MLQMELSVPTPVLLPPEWPWLLVCRGVHVVILSALPSSFPLPFLSSTCSFLSPLVKFKCISHVLITAGLFLLTVLER